jgi:hypothetical protein
MALSEKLIEAVKNEIIVYLKQVGSCEKAN